MNTASLRQRFAAAALAITLPFAIASCGDSHEKATKDMISSMNKLADAMEGITDKASAEAAKDKLKSLGEEMKSIKARMDKLGKPSGDAEKALKDKYEKDLEAAMKRMMGAAMKAATAGPDVQEAFKSIGDVMK